jgi:hypothetical protein
VVRESRLADYKVEVVVEVVIAVFKQLLWCSFPSVV